MSPTATFSEMSVFDPKMITNVIVRELGETVTGLTPVTGTHKGDQGTVFRASINRQSVFVKLGKNKRSSDTEAACLSLCAGHGVPTPRVIAYAPTTGYYGKAIMLLTAAEGSPLSSIGELSKHPRLISNAAKTLRIIHDIKLDGLSGLVNVGEQARGIPLTLSRSTRDSVADVDYLISNSVISRDEASFVKATCITQVASLNVFASLLHGDFQPPHIFTDGTNISSVIDFGNATVGDPIKDVATSIFYLAPQFHIPFLTAYGIDANHPSLSNYMVLTTLRKLRYRHSRSLNDRIDGALTMFRYYLKSLTRAL